MNLKKAKDINKDVVNDKLKYENYNKILFNRTYIERDMKWTDFPTKIIIQDRIELIKFLCLLTMIKNTYLKMDIISYKYHIFVYLFVNHIKNIAEYRQLVLMFALVRRAILFSFFSAL